MVETKRRKILGAMLFFCVLSLCLSPGCDWVYKKKTYRVGILSGLDFFMETEDGLKAGLAERGYKEGENIFYYSARTNFEPKKEKQILKKFVEDKMDVIFTFPTEVSLLAKKLTQGTGIPVVFANAFIEGSDLVNSIREPGENITGIRYPGPDIAIKRFEYLMQAIPHAKRVLIPYQKGYPSTDLQLAAVRRGAKFAGVTLVEIPVDTTEELRRGLQAWDQSAEKRIDAILFLAEPLMTLPDAVVIVGEFAKKHNIPFGGAIVSAGGYESFFGVATHSFNVGKQAAFLVDKALEGTLAGTIPVVSAESYFRINYRAATEDFGLQVPPGLLSQANEIIR